MQCKANAQLDTCNNFALSSQAQDFRYAGLGILKKIWREAGASKEAISKQEPMQQGIDTMEPKGAHLPAPFGALTLNSGRWPIFSPSF